MREEKNRHKGLFQALKAFSVLGGVGIYLVVTDMLARRRAGIGGWLSDGALRQGPVTFLQLVPVALVVAGSATNCRGNNGGGGKAITAAIAVSCTSAGGTIDAPQKFLGTP